MTQSQYLGAFLVDGHFHGIDLVVIADDALGQFHVALQQGIDRRLDLRFDQTTETQNTMTNRQQFVIVLLGNMVMPEIVLGLGHYRHVESCEGGWYRARWVHAIIVQLD